MTLKKTLVALAALSTFALAHADVNVGVTVSATGPAASLGIPEKNTIALMPQTIGGQKINYIVLDDASDTSTAVSNTRKLITESKVDVILGSTTTPNSLAMIDVVAENQTPMISMAASARIVEPVDAKKRWVFKTPQNDIMMSLAIATSMADSGVKTVGFIGFSDAYGEGWYGEFAKAAALKGLTIVANERYARTDTSVTGQVLKLVAAKPDAVLVAASGTPAVLPQRTLKERGYTGKYYQTHGVANNDFLRVGGKDVEGAFVTSGPAVIPEQLPADHPSKALAADFVAKYEKAYGVGNRNQFAGHAYDAVIVLEKVIPMALKKARPGTKEFRAAIRDATETMGRTVVSHGVLNYTHDNHWGFTTETGLVLKVVNGDWKVE